MSVTHFQSIQQMIEELERRGFRDVTDEVKRDYHPYLFICTLQRPASEQEKELIHIAIVDQLQMLLSQVG